MSHWHVWVGWWSRREAPLSLACVRVLVGLVVLSSVAQMWATDSLLLSLSNEAGGEGYRGFSTDHWLVQWFGGSGPGSVEALTLLVAGGAVCTTIGLGGPLAPFVTLQGCMALFSIHPASGGGHDRVMTNSLWILCLSPASRTLSLDTRLWTGRWMDPTPRPAWARYVLVFQLACIYGATGVQKVGVDWFPWGDYRAVYLSLLIPAWARWDLGAWLGRLYPLTQLGTAITWLWEVSWPLVLLAMWYRETRLRAGRLRAWFNRLDVRWGYAAVGVLMHGTVWALMELGPFSAIMLAIYPVLWHPDELSRRVRRLSGASGAW